jgi:hypothetical protein
VVIVTNNNGFWIWWLGLLKLLYNYNQLWPLTISDCLRLAPFLIWPRTSSLPLWRMTNYSNTELPWTTSAWRISIASPTDLYYSRIHEWIPLYISHAACIEVTMSNSWFLPLSQEYRCFAACYLATGTWLPSRCSVMDIRSGSTIPAFNRNVAILYYIIVHAYNLHSHLQTITWFC